MSVPVRSQAIEAAAKAMGIGSYPTQAERDIATRQLECGIQAVLAAEGIALSAPRHVATKEGSFTERRLCGPWRRVDGD
jgi:hypothetical protein